MQWMQDIWKSYAYIIWDRAIGVQWHDFRTQSGIAPLVYSGTTVEHRAGSRHWCTVARVP